ncbi:hypothetical protein K0C01_02915 [Salinarchaeum sp. IM2453]|uniref:hypothetical protein n=1 Tax=Salinarchaeum sp. IM2453 TaxID=2862870 RepID=UPI001C83B693|nr:hypothetical protein [Salinarchaeum sp. IM2453]QZA89120.1 hypothetical protein K0C01_02915 [Salinarchaeum sp. IM2453]
MNQIEFIGPPGAGKSTLHADLIEQNNLFGGVDDGAIDRLIQEDHRLYQLFYRMAFGRIQSTLKWELFYHRYHRDAFRRYISENVAALDIVPEISRCATRAPEEAVLFYKKTIENYQLAIDSKMPQEIFCWDEGFAMAAVAILWRAESNNFPLKKYFQGIPTPTALVYVDAPREVCLERANSREQQTLSKGWINDQQRAYDRHQTACEHVVETLSDEVKIIHVKNTGSIKKTSEEVSTKLDDMLE